MTELISRRATVEDAEAANKISQWTRESGTMLPKTIDDLLTLFKNNDSVLVFDDEGSLISHAGITYVYSDGSVEIGCVITDPEKRKNGAAKHAIKEVIILANDKYPGSTKFALCNEYSAPIFEKVGAIKMSSTELSLEVWVPCKDCPRIPKQKPNKPFVCCDTPYNLSGLS